MIVDVVIWLIWELILRLRFWCILEQKIVSEHIWQIIIIVRGLVLLWIPIILESPIPWWRTRFLTLLSQEVCSHSLLLLILILHAYHILAVNLIWSRGLRLIFFKWLVNRAFSIDYRFIFNKNWISFQACQVSILFVLFNYLFDLICCVSNTLNSFDNMVLLLIRWWHLHGLYWTILDFLWNRYLWLHLNRLLDNIWI